MRSKGIVTLSNITASSNGSYDAGTDTYTGEEVHVDNTAGVAGVTLTGINVTNSNWTNGLDVASKGPISINNLTANNNGYFDSVDDTVGIPAWNSVNGYGASLNNSTAATPQPITLTGTNQFNNNWYDGLDVFSREVINLNGISANGNGLAHDDPTLPFSTAYGYGVYLKNNYNSALPQDVIIAGTNQFNSNWLSGLVIHSYGNLTLNSLTASGNGQLAYIPASSDFSYGALLDNCNINLVTGVCNAAATVKNVTLTGTNVFNSNADAGLSIYTKGAVSTNNVTANSNVNGMGVRIDNLSSDPSAPQNVTMTGNNQFNGNYYSGLGLHTYGTVLLNSIVANNNGKTGSLYGYGLFLDDYFGSGIHGTLPRNVTLTGTNQFDNNYLEGLWVQTLGAISMNSVEASGNGLEGTVLNNNFTAAVGGITLTGTNTFNNNWYDGLDVYSKGVIALNSITANLNGTAHVDPTANSPEGYGAYMVNDYNTASPQTVSITGTNQFNNNWLDGAIVLSYGTVTLNSTTAVYNGQSAKSGFGYGALLNNCLYSTSACTTVTPAAVNVTGTNTFNNNYSDGLNVSSKGTITLNSVTANYNSIGYGAYVVNAYTTAAPQAVSILGTNQFNNNWLDGLIVNTYGAITLNNTTASSNGQEHSGGFGYGALLNNCLYSGSACTTVTPATVNVTGTNTFSNNYSDGLDVYSKGAITLNNVTASSNTIGDGAYVYNAYTTAAPQAVSILGTNTFSNNWMDGLYVLSYGTITLNSTTAGSNGQGHSVDFGYGTVLDNCILNAGVCTTVTSMAVNVTGNNAFSSNYNSGLWVYSKGAITVSNITVDNNNTGDGAYLENDYTGATAGVTLIGTNQFNANEGDGLDVYSKGAITLTDVDAIGNNGNGAYLDNSANTTIAAGVTLNNINVFSENSGRGLWVKTNGTITVNNLVANANGGRGVWLDNCGYNEVSGLCADLHHCPSHGERQ